MQNIQTILLLIIVFIVIGTIFVILFKKHEKRSLNGGDANTELQLNSAQKEHIIYYITTFDIAPYDPVRDKEMLTNKVFSLDLDLFALLMYYLSQAVACDVENPMLGVFTDEDNNPTNDYAILHERLYRPDYPYVNFFNVDDPTCYHEIDGPFGMPFANANRKINEKSSMLDKNIHKILLESFINDLIHGRVENKKEAMINRIMGQRHRIEQQEQQRQREIKRREIARLEHALGIPSYIDTMVPYVHKKRDTRPNKKLGIIKEDVDEDVF